MKKIFILIVFLLSNQSLSAQETCNPDPNKLITGVPYCDFLKIDSTSTTPNPVEKKDLKERDSQLQEKLEIFSILNSNKHHFQTNNAHKSYRPPLISTPPNNPNANQTNSNGLIQTIPNTPNDNMPLEIPNSTNNQPNEDLPNKSVYY